MDYKIGSFNVKNLNFATNQESGKSRAFDTIARIIKEEDFAIVALQEVLSESALKRIMSSIYLGNKWKCKWDQPSPHKGADSADKRGEGYAYIWNSDLIDLESVEVDNTLRISYPIIWKQYRCGEAPLVRDPYYARFTTTDKLCGGFYEIRLINTHIVYGGTTKAGIQLRKNEFIKLATNIYENIANRRTGNNKVAYTIVLGDYNLSLKTISNIDTKVHIGNRKNKEVITTQSEPTTVSHKKQDDGTFKSDFANDYDHFTFLQEYYKKMDINVERIDPMKYCDTLETYWETISDHIPIKMTINLNKRR